MADNISTDNPVDPDQDYEAGLADNTFTPSDSQVDTAPANQSNPPDPQVPSEVASGFYDNTPVSEIDTAPAPVPVLQAGTFDANGNPVNISPDGTITSANTSVVSNTSQDPLAAAITAATGVANGGTFSGALFGNTTDQASADAARALVQQAQQQQTISQQRQQSNNSDWRVKLSLAPNASYLYNDPNPGILYPLSITNGVIFPYTPQISTAYKANYSAYDLTHSNYRGYFYQNSYIDAINISATFTAQDTDDANYLLAVIHFFRSATKMFYGQDAQRGSPPPLCYLSGLGSYQFNKHPCLIQQFNYTLPADVDYIRAGSVMNLGTNLLGQASRQSVSTFSLFGGLNRLAAAALTKGALPTVPSAYNPTQDTPTYVPTKMEIQLTLLPIQTRQQVSQVFKLQEFANGNQLRGGFW